MVRSFKNFVSEEETRADRAKERQDKEKEAMERKHFRELQRAKEQDLEDKLTKESNEIDSES